MVQNCPHCHQEIPSDAPWNLCPACAFGAALNVDSHFTMTQTGAPKTNTKAHPQDAPDTAQAFGKYVLREKIACGGMGVVYKAWEPGAQRLVALKMIRDAEWASEDDVLRFREEMRATCELYHPNIAPIFEVGEYDGRPYYTMKLMAGGSLAGNLKAYRDDSRRAAELLETIALAVHHGHLRGILHRDLKPANILLDDTGNPYVADFGLAKQINQGPMLTRTGAKMGTPAYMAPEQAEGRPLTIAADIYSLGVILFELITGQLPFRGETVEELMRHVKESPPPNPRVIEPRVPKDLAFICLKCLEKNPEHRYDSARELARDLRLWLNGYSIDKTRWPVRAWRWCLRHPVQAGLLLAGVSFLAMMIGSTYSLASKQESLRRRQIIESNRLSAAMIAGTVLSHVRDLSDAVSHAALDERLGRALEEENEAEIQRFCEHTYEHYDDPSAGLKVENNSAFHVWFVLDRKGIARGIYKPQGRRAVGEDFGFRGYFQGAWALARRGLRGTYVSSVIKGTLDGTHEFAISTPVYRKDGAWMGVLVAAVATKAQLGSLVLDDERNMAVLAAPWEPLPGDSAQERASSTDLPAYLILRHQAYTKNGEALMLDDPQVRRLGRDSMEGEERLLNPLRLSGSRWVDSSDSYEDPLGQGNTDATRGSVIAADPRYTGRWLSGFAAVGHTGFVVIVQTREEEALGPDKRLGLQLAKWTGVASVPSVLFMGIALGYERRRKRTGLVRGTQSRS